ncbi:putative reverse transcriptase domain-containing protein [Tanacetum coccineum]
MTTSLDLQIYQQNPNVVTGTFLLIDHYACILFDSGAEKSFVSSAFTPFIDIAPAALNTSYEVELADGKVISTNTILRSCTLVLFNHVFKIDLLPTRLGSFYVIIRMDWLAYHRSVIDCYEKIICISLPNGEILEVQGERPEKDSGSLACIKVDEKKLDDIRVVRDRQLHLGLEIDKGNMGHRGLIFWRGTNFFKIPTHEPWYRSMDGISMGGVEHSFFRTELVVQVDILLCSGSDYASRQIFSNCAHSTTSAMSGYSSEMLTHKFKGLATNNSSDDVSSSSRIVKRWSFQEKIANLFAESLELSFPDFKQYPVIYASQEGQDGDYNCQNVLWIWPKLRKDPELQKRYLDIKKPTDVAMKIKKNLQESAMIDGEASIQDVGFVAISLSRKWLAESIHKMLKVGIDTWAPELPVKRVLVVDYPLIGVNVGLFQQRAIRDTLVRMLEFSGADVALNIIPRKISEVYMQLI